MVYRLDSNGNDLGVPASDRNRQAMWLAVWWVDREFPSSADVVVYSDPTPPPRPYFGDWS